jgi:hypothetical protein
MENEDNIFEVKKNGEKIFTSRDISIEASLKEVIEDAICKASQLTTLRIGDFIAVELVPVSLMAASCDGETSLKATYCENELFDIKLIF